MTTRTNFAATAATAAATTLALLVTSASPARAQTASTPTPTPDPSWPSYLAHIAAAEKSLRLSEPAEAARWLAAAPAHHRGWEWRHLLAISDESLESIDLGASSILSVDISPDGRLAAFAAADGAITLWDLEARTKSAALEPHADAVFCVRFSPDGARLVTASRDRTAKVWSVATREPLLTFTAHPNPVTAAVFSPDGAHIATSSYERLKEPPHIQGTVHIWNSTTGDIANTVTGGVKPLSSLAFSPDGAHIAAGSWDSVVFLWSAHPSNESPEVNKPAAPRVFGAPPGANSSTHVQSIDFSPDGALLAAAIDDKTLRVYSIASGAEVFTTSAHDRPLECVAFSPDGATLASGGYDDAARLWRTSDWAPLATLRGHRAAVRALAWSPDGDTLLTGGLDGAVRRWDPHHTAYGALRTKHTDACYAVMFTPDGARLVSAGYDGVVAVLDARTGAHLAHWQAHDAGPICLAALSPDGRLVATTSWDKSARLFDLETHERLHLLEHPVGLEAVAFSPDSAVIATGALDGVIRLWSARTGELLRELTGHDKKGIHSLAFSPDGARLASASSDATARLWNIAPVTDPTGGAVVQPLGAAPRSDSDASKRPTDNPLLATLSERSGSVYSVAFSPHDGGALLATSGATDGDIHLWNGHTGAHLALLHDGDEPAYRVLFSPDGARLAAATTELLLLSPFGGAVIPTGGAVVQGASPAPRSDSGDSLTIRLHPHSETLWNLSFSPDGRRLATCSWDGTITILETAPLRDRPRDRQ